MQGKWKKIKHAVFTGVILGTTWANYPLISYAGNFNVWNHLGTQPYVKSFYAVGGQGLYILLMKLIVYSSALSALFSIIALFIVKNPKVVLKRKQDIIDKLLNIALASGGVTLLNLLYNLCTAIFYK